MIRELNRLLPATEVMALVVIGLLVTGSLLFALFSWMLHKWRQLTRDRQGWHVGRKRWITATS
jgi:hypothetical protein